MTVAPPRIAGTITRHLRTLSCETSSLTANPFDLAKRLYEHWLDWLGPDNHDTLHAAHSLVFALAVLGKHREARDLAEDTFNRRRHVLGEDHPITLGTASNLAVDLSVLGECLAARDLLRDTLPRTAVSSARITATKLRCACSLAADLRALRKYQAARDLDQDTLTRQQRVLGNDHPDTGRTVGRPDTNSTSGGGASRMTR